MVTPTTPAEQIAKDAECDTYVGYEAFCDLLPEPVLDLMRASLVCDHGDGSTRLAEIANCAVVLSVEPHPKTENHDARGFRCPLCRVGYMSCSALHSHLVRRDPPEACGSMLVIEDYLKRRTREKLESVARIEAWRKVGGPKYRFLLGEPPCRWEERTWPLHCTLAQRNEAERRLFALGFSRVIDVSEIRYESDRLDAFILADPRLPHKCKFAVYPPRGKWTSSAVKDCGVESPLLEVCYFSMFWSRSHEQFEECLAAVIRVGPNVGRPMKRVRRMDNSIRVLSGGISANRGRSRDERYKVMRPSDQ